MPGRHTDRQAGQPASLMAAVHLSTFHLQRAVGQATRIEFTTVNARVVGAVSQFVYCGRRFSAAAAAYVARLQWQLPTRHPYSIGIYKMSLESIYCTWRQTYSYVFCICFWYLDLILISIAKKRFCQNAKWFHCSLPWLGVGQEKYRPHLIAFFDKANMISLHWLNN